MPADASAKSQERVCVGAVIGARGLKGELRVKSFTDDPDDLFAYGPVSDETGQHTFKGRISGRAKDHLLVFLKGVGDRTRADELKGTRFYVSRDALPAPDDDEFYHADLIGLNAELVDGGVLGPIRGVMDVGGGASLEIDTEDGLVMIPFTRAAVPVVDIVGERVVIDPPDGLFEEPEREPEDKGE